MDLWYALIQGIVEGITEFLPVSSTAHLMLTAHFLGIPATQFQKSFEIIIQFGAICSVIALYWRSFLNVVVLKKLLVAFIPTGAIGFVAYKAVKVLLGDVTIVLWTLLFGGVALIVFEYWYKRRRSDVPPEDDSPTAHRVSHISYGRCLAIGVFQAIAIVPGVSRSAATIIGGLALGIPRTTIVEFSFLLAVPTMLAATGFDFLKNYRVFSSADFSTLAVGFVVSFVVALASIRFLLRFIKTNDFTLFGIYRVVVAALLFFFL
ncbi:MAG: undecaprenyl-diphosphate phosphatase [Patescibacteria group bacterium]